ncbi:MAG: hypothetical protein HQK63_13495 [Desulfamplus sp.]|nr:hypothetical protein [Desulfamplus sp.]
MKKKSILYMVFITIALLLFSTGNSHAVENIFHIDGANFPFSGPSTIISLDDGLSMAVINRISKKIFKIKHNQVVLERAFENFEPFDLLAVNGELFVSCKNGGDVKVLSQIDLSLIKTIPVNKSATYMALSSDKTRIYVASPLKSADTIGIINVASKTLISPPIYVFDLNLVSKLFAHSGKLFATSQISTTIAVFNEKTGKNEGKYSFGLIPDDIVVTDTHLYISSIEEQLIRIVDLKSFEKVKDIPFNGSPGRMVFDGDQYIYVLNSDRTGKIFRLDINTDEFDDVSCFESGDCFYTGANPEDAVISRDGKVLYVSNYSDNSVTWHFISGKLFIEPRTITLKPLNDASQTGSSENPVKLKAGGGSGNYIWSATYGQFSDLLGNVISSGNVTGEEVMFTPPSGEDIYYVTVQDKDSSATANSKIIVVNIRVTPERLTVPDQNAQTFNITGGTPPYEIFALQGGVIQYIPGESNFTFSPPTKDGIYTIEVKDKNGSKAYATVELASEGVPVLPLDASRAAIIVAGGPPDTRDNPIWPLVRVAAEKIYMVLTTKKGFTKEQIYLLSPIDLDGDEDGVPDEIIRNTKGYLEEKYIETAFQWAGELKKLDQPLLIFLLGHGTKDQFMLNLKNKTLDADKLNQYLDEYQNVTGKEVVVVMDSCYSGSFIDDLAGPGRAIITATGEDNKSYYTMNESMLSSFSSHFSDGIKRGVSLLESYNYACQELKNFYSKKMCSKQYDRQQIFFQNPQYDDNGDGKYYDLFMNLKTDDGLMLKNIYIKNPSSSDNRTTSVGTRSIPNHFSSEETNTSSELSDISDMTLSIVSMNSQVSETVSPRDTITLKAKVGLAKGTVKNVYGILKPPGMKISIDENGISNLSYPQIKLAKNDEELKELNLESYNSQIWATQWNEAVYQGCYEINFYAQSENGSVAFSDPISFSVSAYDAPPSPDKSSVEILFNVTEDSDTSSGESSENTSHEYSTGDKLNICIIEHLNWGYDLYAAIVIPDGTTLLSFSGLNQLKAFTGSEDSVFKWQGERYQDKKLTILDMEIPKGLPNGKYQVYAVMVPQGKSIFDNADYFILSASSFAINP